MLLALAFTAAVAAWLQWSDARDAEEERTTLITDALTVESRIAVWVADEQERIAALAALLPAQVDDAALLRQPAVASGLQRLWISVTALGAGNRLAAHVPEQTPRSGTPAASSGLDEGGLSAHLSAPLQDGGRLIVRFAPASLLRQTLPWWLARKYDVRLIDTGDRRGLCRCLERDDLHILGRYELYERWGGQHVRLLLVRFNEPDVERLRADAVLDDQHY